MSWAGVEVELDNDMIVSMVVNVRVGTLSESNSVTMLVTTCAGSCWGAFRTLIELAWGEVDGGLTELELALSNPGNKPTMGNTAADVDVVVSDDVSRKVSGRPDEMIRGRPVGPGEGEVDISVVVWSADVENAVSSSVDWVFGSRWVEESGVAESRLVEEGEPVSIPLPSPVVWVLVAGPCVVEVGISGVEVDRTSAVDVGFPGCKMSLVVVGASMVLDRVALLAWPVGSVHHTVERTAGGVAVHPMAGPDARLFQYLLFQQRFNVTLSSHIELKPSGNVAISAGPTILP